MKTLKTGIKNWKTTLIGAGAATAFVSQSGDEITWQTIVAAILMAIAGLLQRDADKSSEDSGAK